MANNTSPHILGTCTNLMGFCLILITSFHIAEKSESTLVDEITAVVALLLTFSSIFSFISIRTKNPKLETRLETLAEVFFALCLAGIIGILLFILSHFMHNKEVLF